MLLKHSTWLQIFWTGDNVYSPAAWTSVNKIIQLYANNDITDTIMFTHQFFHLILFLWNNILYDCNCIAAGFAATIVLITG